MKKTNRIIVALILTLSLCFGLAACGPQSVNDVAGIIKQAEQMSSNELYVKAMEEWTAGKVFNATGNSSRGKTALEYLVAYLRGQSYSADKKGFVDDPAVQKAFPQYNKEFEGKYSWGQPKNNNIFGQISADIKASKHTFSMTLIQDGNQIQSKMLETGNLLNYIPKDWKGDKASNGEPFALQSLNKVFEFNNLGSETYKNCWDFVRNGSSPMFMGPNSEPVGKNFLYMLTNEHYSKIMKDAYDALDAADKTRINGVIAGLEKKNDKGVSTIDEIGITHANVKYSLAWIQLWMQQYNELTDDGPICKELVKNSAAGQSGLLVYSKLRSIADTADVSRKNVTIAAYQDGYKGIGGYMYKHYLQVLKTSPMPWTACALINFMTTTKDGFAAWGKDIGGYCSNPSVNQDHSNDGGTEIPALNDKGYDWWINQTTGGKMVIEDPSYCASIDYAVGSWIASIKHN